MKAKTCEEILSALAPVAAAMEIEIVDIEFKTNKNPHLTVFIDKEGGVDLDTCEAFHRAIDPLLDELDPTDSQPYTLNVSSPGLDRPLKTKRDFDKCTGEKVELKLYAPVKGKKYYEGVLLSYDGNSVVIDAGGEQINHFLNNLHLWTLQGEHHDQP